MDKLLIMIYQLVWSPFTIIFTQESRDSVRSNEHYYSIEQIHNHDKIMTHPPYDNQFIIDLGNWILHSPPIKIADLGIWNWELASRTGFRETDFENLLSRTRFWELAFENSLSRTHFRELAFKNSLSRILKYVRICRSKLRAPFPSVTHSGSRFVMHVGVFRPKVGVATNFS
jgi:hypothetical protein